MDGTPLISTELGRFHTASGLPLPVAPGPVWILLVPV